MLTRLLITPRTDVTAHMLCYAMFRIELYIPCLFTVKYIYTVTWSHCCFMHGRGGIPGVSSPLTGGLVSTEQHGVTFPRQPGRGQRGTSADRVLLLLDHLHSHFLDSKLTCIHPLLFFFCFFNVIKNIYFTAEPRWCKLSVQSLTYWKWPFWG